MTSGDWGRQLHGRVTALWPMGAISETGRVLGAPRKAISGFTDPVFGDAVYIIDLIEAPKSDCYC